MPSTIHYPLGPKESHNLTSGLNPSLPHYKQLHYRVIGRVIALSGHWNAWALICLFWFFFFWHGLTIPKSRQNTKFHFRPRILALREDTQLLPLINHLPDWLSKKKKPTRISATSSRHIYRLYRPYISNRAPLNIYTFKKQAIGAEVFPPRVRACDQKRPQVGLPHP